MAWLERFDDFADEWDGKQDLQQNSKAISGRQSNQTYSRTGRNFVNAGVNRLCDITPQTSDVTVVGVIIAKEQQRTIFSKKNAGSERHLVSFTLRDSPSCFVNVTCWGNADFISDISNNFEVGSVVQLKNIQVQPKAANQTDEKFKPWTPVSFQLTVSENHGAVEAYSGWDSAAYRNNMSIPTRPSNDYYTLEDINISGMTLDGEHVNILAAVKKVGQIRYLMTKTGKQTKKCDVILFDDTCPSFTLDLWQNNAEATLLWTPFETVLFVADVKITYNSFKSRMVATADSKTIFTTDPDTQEAHCLRQFLKTQDHIGADVDCDVPHQDEEPDLNSITEVFTVQELQTKRASMAKERTAVTHYGLLYAMLTSFNVDAQYEDTVRNICGHCRKPVALAGFAVCTNPECGTQYTNSGADTSKNIVAEYKIPVSLSDYTGTVSYCQLQQNVAEALTSCQPQAFLMMPQEHQTSIKWQYLLEACKIVFKLRKFNNQQGIDRLPAVYIMSLEKQTYTQQTASQKPRQQQGQY